jgi:hypothetical protein
MSNFKKQYAAAKKADKLTVLTPTYVKWEKEGQQIVGAYVGQNTVVSSVGVGSYNQYLFETDDGLVKFALGSAADSEFAPVLAKGYVYSITYLGKEKIAKGRSVNRFNIEQVDITDLPDDIEEKPKGNGRPVDKK